MTSLGWCGAAPVASFIQSVCPLAGAPRYKARARPAERATPRLPARGNCATPFLWHRAAPDPANSKLSLRGRRMRLARQRYARFHSCRHVRSNSPAATRVRLRALMSNQSYCSGGSASSASRKATAFSGLSCDSAMMVIAFQSSPMRSSSQRLSHAIDHRFSAPVRPMPRLQPVELAQSDLRAAPARLAIAGAASCRRNGERFPHDSKNSFTFSIQDFARGL